MLWNVLAISFLSLIACLISALINGYLLSATFITEKLQKSAELLLFYVRFAIDIVFGIFNGTNLLIVLIYHSGLQDFINSNRNWIFYISWTTINLITVRALLVLLITTDRTMAVYLPIFYHNNRKKVGNFWIFLSLLGWLLINNMVLWLICSYQLSVPPGCISFGCSSNTCYIKFWMAFEQVIYSLIALSSVVLSVKLYVWNNCSKTSQKSADLSRANRLAVIDTIVIFVFDLLPSAILARFLTVELQNLGPIGSLLKSIGFLIEGVIVIRAMIRKSQLAMESSSRSITMGKSNQILSGKK